MHKMGKPWKMLLAIVLCISLTVPLFVAADVTGSSGDNQRPLVVIVHPVDGVEPAHYNVTGTAHDPDGMVERVEIRLTPTGEWWMANGTNHWYYNMSERLNGFIAEGTYTVSVRSYDGERYSDIATARVPVGNVVTETTITSPADGETVSGKVVVRGTASDLNGADTIRRVDVTIDTPPNEGHPANGTTHWYYVWDTTMVSDGEHHVSAIAYDEEEMSTDVGWVSVMVDNMDNGNDGDMPPLVAIVHPVDGAEPAHHNITGTAHDPDGVVERVEIRWSPQGNWTEVNGTTEWYYNFTERFDGSGLMSSRDWTIYARSYDGERYSDVASVRFPVGNVVTITNITSPETNETVSGRVVIRGTARDPNGNETIEGVVISIDAGPSHPVNGTTHWYYVWDTTTVSDGEHLIVATGCDESGMANMGKFVTVTVDNTGEDGGDIAGFEFALVLAAAFIALAVLRRRS